MKLKIDYPNHPGFKNLAEVPIRSVPEINGHFEDINEVYENFLKQTKKFSPQRVDHLIDTEIVPSVEKMRQIVSEVMKPGEWYRPVMSQVLDGLVSTLRAEFHYREKQRHYRQKKISAKGEKIVNDLNLKGVSVQRIDSKIINEIWEGLREYRTALELTRASCPKGMASCVISLPKKGSYWTVTKKALEDLGIIDAVNAYSKFPMDLEYCAMQLSHEHEEWYKDCYSDVGLGTQKTAYMHYDQDFSLMKAIIYLEEVDKDKGPFSFIEGQNFLHGNYIIHRFLTELDHISFSQAISEKKNTNMSYYRPIFKLNEMRREFLKLPTEFQGTTHFGDDLVDGTPLSNYFLSKETKLTSDMGNCALFTGGRNVHRGGTVPKGERWAFQVGFRQKDLSLGGGIKRVERHIKLHTASFIKKAVRTLRPSNKI